MKSVDAATLDVVIRSVNTFLSSDDAHTQKKSYKILKSVAAFHPEVLLANAEVWSLLLEERGWGKGRGGGVWRERIVKLYYYACVCAERNFSE